MDLSIQSTEKDLLAAIEDLRARFPRTQDLYREVCVLLFFRQGITPTANKLYQLVRKGSMSAPTEALSHFWDTLRERSRVRIEHADLPDDLQSAAGEVVAALWKSAQTMSRNALAGFQAESAAAVDAARSGEAQAKAGQAEAVEALEQARAQARGAEELVGQLRQELAAAGATKAGLEASLEDLRGRLADVQMRLDQSHDEYAVEREKLAERTRLAEHRFADMEKRALLEVDRERTTSARLQKALETERGAHAAASERLHADHNAALSTIGKLREQVGALQNSVDTFDKERNREGAEIQSLRVQLEAAILQAAVDSARAEEIRGELQRYRTDAKTRPERATQLGHGSKRQRKPSRIVGEP
ncbi:DNA-binding protein [Massilia cavernae]|uniref:DNA-binding protein n=1 Tax=Massilia cavernae TaxID=2320864 RepID=A0A418Y8H6_9BURK|nr:DNA-binding protein [Massilia cavernae]RJG28002.1 DNA-binding protein [Massilia cavernae]